MFQISINVPNKSLPTSRQTIHSSSLHTVTLSPLFPLYHLFYLFSNRIDLLSFCHKLYKLFSTLPDAISTTYEIPSETLLKSIYTVDNVNFQSEARLSMTRLHYLFQIKVDVLLKTSSTLVMALRYYYLYLSLNLLMKLILLHVVFNHLNKNINLSSFKPQMLHSIWS